MLIHRGVAGVESLHYRATDGAEVTLVPLSGEPWCSGKIFCDYPPNPAGSRILFYDFLGAAHAIYLTAENDPAQNEIASVELATGQRKRLSDAVTWGALEGSRPGYVYGFAIDGLTTYWSILDRTGARLYRSNGPSDPLVLISERPLLPDHVPVASRVEAARDRVMWFVETLSTAPNQGFFQDNALLDRNGTVLFGPDDLKGRKGDCEPALLRANRYLVTYYEDDIHACKAVAVDTQTLQARTLDTPPRTYQAAVPYSEPLSSDGRYLVLRQQSDVTYDTAHVYDLETGEEIADFPATHVHFWPGTHRLASRLGTTVSLRNLPAVEEQVLFDGNYFWSFNQPSIVFDPAGSWTATIFGYAEDLEDNVGVRLARLDTGAKLDVEPEAVSMIFYRHLRAAPDGRRLAYLHPHDDQLDIVLYDVATGERVTVGSPTEHERGFVLGGAGVELE